MKKLLTLFCVYCFFSSVFASEKPTSSFAIDYLNKNELFLYEKYNSTNVVNAEYSFSEYASYLQDSFKDLPFSKILYTPTSYLLSTGNMVFLFDLYSISSVIYQTIQSENDFKKLLDIHNKRFGDPILSTSQGKTSKIIWETNSGNILISHTVRPLGFTLQNMVTETPHPGFAFIDLENVNFGTSLSIWKLLKENKIIDINGLAIAKDLDKNLNQLDKILSPLELSSINIQKLKVMLLATTYGETNILYLNKSNSFLLNDTEDEDFNLMLQ
jgi:hypothetical protein